MSRFYAALREASRSPLAPGAKPEEDVTDVLAPADGHSPTTQVSVPEEQDQVALDPAPEDQKLASEALHRELLERVRTQFNGPAIHSEPPQVSAPPPESAPVESDPVESAPAPQEEVAAAPAPAAAVKTRIHFNPTAHLITQAVDTIAMERYRRLRTKILQQHATKPFKNLLITSPNPQEGKTVTVLNLALSFAMVPNFKVLAVDADLRRGTIGKLLGIEDHPGLSNLMDGTAQLSDVVVESADLPIQFVLRGNSKVAPAELLHSPRVSEVFRSMTAEFDLVLVDSPPVNLLTDAQLLAGYCDAVLLVARAFSSSRKGIEQAARELSPFRVIGTILNGGTRAQLYSRYHGYY